MAGNANRNLEYWILPKNSVCEECDRRESTVGTYCILCLKMVELAETVNFDPGGGKSSAQWMRSIGTGEQLRRDLEIPQ